MKKILLEVTEDQASLLISVLDHHCSYLSTRMMQQLFGAMDTHAVKAKYADLIAVLMKQRNEGQADLAAKHGQSVATLRDQLHLLDKAMGMIKGAKVSILGSNPILYGEVLNRGSNAVAQSIANEIAQGGRDFADRLEKAIERKSPEEVALTCCATGSEAAGRSWTTNIDIMVNGRKVTLDGDVLTYEKAVELAATGRKAVHSVVYGHRVPFNSLPGERDGMLYPGKSVKATIGMVVTAVVTGDA